MARPASWRCPLRCHRYVQKNGVHASTPSAGRTMDSGVTLPGSFRVCLRSCSRGHVLWRNINGALSKLGHELCSVRSDQTSQCLCTQHSGAQIPVLVDWRVCPVCTCESQGVRLSILLVQYMKEHPTPLDPPSWIFSPWIWVPIMLQHGLVFKLLWGPDRPFEVCPHFPAPQTISSCCGNSLACP